MSEYKKGHIPWHKGKKLSEEHKRKIGEAMKRALAGGRILSEKHKENISKALKKWHKNNPGIFAGKKHSQWKGGISDYSNYGLMNKMRIQVLKEANNKCGRCDQKAHEIHHVDFSKDNHKRENLIPLCYECHKAIHANHRLVEKICSENLRGESCQP